MNKAVELLSQLVDQYERNFDKGNRDFGGRVEYVRTAIINLGAIYSRMNQPDKAKEFLDMMPKIGSE